MWAEAAVLSLHQIQLTYRNPIPAGSLFFRGNSHISYTCGSLKRTRTPLRCIQHRSTISAVSLPDDRTPLDLTEDNVIQVLADARAELGQIFDGSVGITGKAELAELDGPFVKIRLTGRFWHKRTTVLARIGNYLKQRIPEILEVDIEDEKQFDDSPENF